MRQGLIILLILLGGCAITSGGYRWDGIWMRIGETVFVDYDELDRYRCRDGHFSIQRFGTRVWARCEWRTL